jgi:hypothetical protein
MENFSIGTATCISRGLSAAYAHALKQRTDAFSTSADPVMGLGAPPPRETEALR